MTDEQPSLTVYYDGACPLCRAEIGQYKRSEGSSAVAFVDVSAANCPPHPGLSREAALQRLHVAKSDGSLVSGARAFVCIWKTLPRWRWLAHVAAFPGMIHILEGGYRLILLVRPRIARLWSGLKRR